MNNENQQLIIIILGLSMNITLIGLISIILLQNIDSNEVLIFSSIITTIIGILGGFLTGKNMAEEQTITEEENNET